MFQLREIRNMTLVLFFLFHLAISSSDIESSNNPQQEVEEGINSIKFRSSKFLQAEKIKISNDTSRLLHLIEQLDRSTRRSV